MKKYLPLQLSAVVLAADFLAVEWIWTRKESLFGLLASTAFFVCLLAVVLRHGSGQAWSKPEKEDSYPGPEKNRWPSRARLFFACLGTLFVCAAFKFTLQDSFDLALVFLAAAALAWRPIVETRPLKVGVKWAVALAGLVMALGILYRFYKVGAIPQGLVSYDETGIHFCAVDILYGKREIYNTMAHDGQLPYWAATAGMYLFGDTIQGFRMAGLIASVIAVGMMIGLGRELGGTRLGLIAGAFTSMAYWAVSFARPEYLLNSSYVPFLGCLWLLLLGLRRGSPMNLAFSGMCLGYCFYAYSAVMALPFMLGLFIVLIWLWQKDWRQPLKWAVAPFLGGMIIALAPLLLWAAHDPAAANATYFRKMDDDWVVGNDFMQATGAFERASILLRRVLPYFQAVLPMIATKGERLGYVYMLPDMPMLDHATVFLTLSGMAACLARFKKPGYALMLCWWFLGFVPALLAIPFPPVRRIMLVMPATMLLAAVGLLTYLDFLTRGLKARLGNALVLLACLVFFALWGRSNWRAYFVEVNQDKAYLDNTRANFVNGVRAVREEDDKSPVYLLTFRKPNMDSWPSPNPEHLQDGATGFFDAIPRITCQWNGPEYFKAGGLYWALEQIPAGYPDHVVREPLVLLTPFHFYLEPLLVKNLGGVRVRDVYPAESTTGPSRADFGFVPFDSGPVHRLVRLKGFTPAKLKELKENWMFKYTVEELTPPPAFGTRDSLAKFAYTDPVYVKGLKNYAAQPGSWRTGKKTAFSLPDVYFWITVNNFPDGVRTPLRLKGDWQINIPSDGKYALGASATIYTTLSVDGKKIFTFLPATGDKLQAGMEGSLCDPVFLKAGAHRLSVEQVMFSSVDNYNHALRLIWKKPNGEKETLPLEFLSP